MSTAFLIAVSNGLAHLPEDKSAECTRPDCSSLATENFMGEMYCYIHMIIAERMEE